jgi:hypothetical protein
MLNNVIGVEEAAEKWELSAGYIKNLCAEGKISAKKIGKTWVIDGTQERPNTDLTDEEKNLFTSKNENEFFTKSEYSHIGHDFNYEALADLTSEQFAEKIDDLLRSCYVKSFQYETSPNNEFTWINLYAEGFRKEDFVFVHGAYSIMESGKDFIKINHLEKKHFDKVGMTIAYK